MAKVCAVLQQREGKIHRMAWETVAAAQQLAALCGRKSLGGPPRAATSLGLAAEVAGCDLESVLVIDHPLLADYTPGGYVAALAGLIALETSRDPPLSAHLPDDRVHAHAWRSPPARAFVPEGLSFESDGAGGVVWKRPILGGKMHARVRARGSRTDDGLAAVGRLLGGRERGRVRRRSPRSLSTCDGGFPWREILGVEQVGGETVDLTKAEIIVAIGRGIGGADKMGPVEELARLLKADIGASRPVIDSGWLPRDRQIGSSGQTVSPKLYLAFGISGAIQHLVGMKGSSCIVAVNKDAGAPIFKIANYGIVGDLHEVIPAMVAALKEG